MTVRRRRKTRGSVLLMDRLSRLFITIAGLGTIIAVSTVFLFLVWVAVPLFRSASSLEETKIADVGERKDKASAIAGAVNDDQTMGWVLSREGVLSVFRVSNGEILDRQTLFEGAKLTAFSLPSLRTFNDDKGAKVSQYLLAFGFEDGSIRVGTFQFNSSYPAQADLPAEVHDLEVGQVARVDKGMVERTKERQFHLVQLKFEMPGAAKPPSKSPVRALDHTLASSGSVICSLSAEGRLRFNQIKEQVPLDPDLPTIRRLVGHDLPFQSEGERELPQHLVITQAGDQLFLIWKDGRFHRYDLRNAKEGVVAERGSFLDRPGVQVTAIRQLIGRRTLLIGDSSGTVSAWFSIKPERSQTIDGQEMVRGHTLPGPSGEEVSCIDISSRGRVASVGYSGGHVRVYNITSENLVVDFQSGTDRILDTILAPKVNGVIALTAQGGRHYTFDPHHHEVTLKALFGKVWYEGSERPVFKWESSSGTDDYEPKYSLVPLVFGTLKATFYSLLFGVPLALLAAIYTSEFMRPRARGLVKPVIETMASLPSVVLGFLAGLFFAQFVENKVISILCCFFMVPLTFAVGAQVVQMLPERLSLAFNRFRFLCFIPSVALGIWLGSVIGPVVEKVFFGGDLRDWLNDQNASATGGWLLLFLPVCMLLSAIFMGSAVSPRLRHLSLRWGRFRCALLDLARFTGGLLLALGFALGCSLLFQALGLDARGSFIDTYDQRNMLVTGFAIGFAVVPIIFTIADDALSAVPDHLRSGSLATGATPWQTAMRIVIPTAMSGLFSAVMIGMGRAIGETMILVMASGNVPVLDLNVFNGCRTLSANIAVELPEAEKGSTHFRLLFFSALVLFAMTFTLNTIAEIVRLRFRRRSYQL